MKTEGNEKEKGRIVELAKFIFTDNTNNYKNIKKENKKGSLD